LLQRLTAVLLFFFLGIHWWATHFVEPGTTITFESVLRRMQQPLFQFVDLSLLAVAIYHGLNGVRMVVLDFGIGLRRAKLLTWILLIIGLLGFLFGLNALWPFLSPSNRPLLQEVWWSLTGS
jgi:succinate dehydrogenase cytochrome b556 subunit